MDIAEIEFAESDTGPRRGTPATGVSETRRCRSPRGDSRCRRHRRRQLPLWRTFLTGAQLISAAPVVLSRPAGLRWAAPRPATSPGRPAYTRTCCSRLATGPPGEAFKDGPFGLEAAVTAVAVQIEDEDEARHCGRRTWELTGRRQAAAASRLQLTRRQGSGTVGSRSALRALEGGCVVAFHVHADLPGLLLRGPAGSSRVRPGGAKARTGRTGRTRIEDQFECAPRG